MQKMSQDSYIKKIVEWPTLEELGKSLEGRITELKEAYRTKAPSIYTQGLREDIDYLLKQVEKTIKQPYQLKKAQEQSKRYMLLVSAGKILSGPELDRILGDDKKEEPETIELTVLEQPQIFKKAKSPSDGSIMREA